MKGIETSQSVAGFDSLRRSPLGRQHATAGALFASLGDADLVLSYGDASDEVEQARLLSLADLTTLPRDGLKGSESLQWLKSRGLDVPEQPNQSVRQEDGRWLLRLSREEFCLLPCIANDDQAFGGLEADAGFAAGKRVYSVSRRDSHSWFALTGKHSYSVLAKLCGIDLRPTRFAIGDVAQSSIARINAIVSRVDFGNTTVFYVLSDSSFAEYLWDSLQDAMSEFNGHPVGLAALRSLLADPENNPGTRT